MNIKNAIEKGTIDLKMDNIDTPKMTARMLMQYVLKKDRQYIIVYDKKELKKTEELRYFRLINKIRQGTPIQHITHLQEFMKMNFYVDKNVLIPRADTEILVEEVIKIAKKINARKILDLCTGSGAIAVSLAKFIEDSQITAVDISNKALDVAKNNAKTNKVADQITFVKSDLFNELGNEKYDLIVSNPPYIKKNVMKTLSREVKKEPKIALDGGYDGLDFYRKIINKTHEYLKHWGYICFEIGYDQKDDVIDLLNEQDRYDNIYSKKDLYDKDRIVCGRLVK